MDSLPALLQPVLEVPDMWLESLQGDFHPQPPTVPMLEKTPVDHRPMGQGSPCLIYPLESSAHSLN